MQYELSWSWTTTSIFLFRTLLSAALKASLEWAARVWVTSLATVPSRDSPGDTGRCRDLSLPWTPPSTPRSTPRRRDAPHRVISAGTSARPRAWTPWPWPPPSPDWRTSPDGRSRIRWETPGNDWGIANWLKCERCQRYFLLKELYPWMETNLN